jgi:glycosyltransferase involved in cell wall biosynthesis
MAKTVYFDITRMYNWNGPLVGFVRVELESARHLLRESNSRIHFCRYDFTLEAPVEVSDEEIELHIQRLDTYVERSPSHSSADPSWKLRTVVKRAIQYLPQQLQKAFIQSLRRYRRIEEKAKRVSARLPSRGPVPPRQIPVSIEPKLKQGDVYVTLTVDCENDLFPRIHAIKKKIGIKVMGMCYDLMPVKFPHFTESDFLQAYSGFIQNMARCADKILCISRSTLHDLEQFLSPMKEPCPRLEVIRLGSNIKAETDVIGRQVRDICHTPYILFVSNIERRKNHEILYRAYKKLAQEGFSDLPKLVFVGRPGWAVNRLLSDIRLDQSVCGSIHMINHVSDSELSYLYRHALFTVFPSLYEGWGLPVAESLAYGKFCIASSASSLPEVGGDFVEYLDPTDLSAWVERLAYYFKDRQAIRDRETEIRLHYKAYTWTEAARALVNHALSI